MDNMYKSSDNDDYSWHFVQEYINSKKKISKLLNSENNGSKKDTYFAIDSQWLSQFKNYLGFNEINSELKKSKIKSNTDKAFEKIKSILDKCKKKSKIHNLDNSLIFKDKSSIKKGVDPTKDF